MKNISLGACVAMAAGIAATALHAVTIVSYPIEGRPSASPAFTAPGVTATDLTQGGGLTRTSEDFVFAGWTFGGSAARARTNGDYLTFGFTASGMFDLGALSFRTVSSQQGPRNFALDIDVDGTGFQLVKAFRVDPIETPVTIDLSAFTGVGSASFQLLGWSAPSGFGSGGLKGRSGDLAFELTGAVVAPPPPPPPPPGPSVVPLPAGLPLLGMALLSLAALRRRSAIR